MEWLRLIGSAGNPLSEAKSRSTNPIRACLIQLGRPLRNGPPR